MNADNRVLVVEDDEDVISNLRDILELDGYQVMGVGTLKEATSRYPLSDYFLILLDRTLPDGNADSLLPHIQQSAPRTGVIVITGHADWDGVVAALRGGAADYLLKPVNGDVLRAVVARVKKMQETVERARQAERLAAIGQMAAALAHESANALQRIRANAEMLELEVPNNEIALDHIARIQTAQSHLESLLGEVRNYAAPIRLGRSSFKIQEAWQEAWSDLEKARRGRDAELHEQCEAGGQIDADRRRLVQVFRNLLENSLAAAEDPVRIDIACEPALQGLTTALSIRYRDNGPGLNAEQRERVFEAFFTTKTKGTGLGMAIAKRIVEAHGGDLAVSDRKPPGAEFLITLPVVTRT